MWRTSGFIARLLTRSSLLRSTVVGLALVTGVLCAITTALLSLPLSPEQQATQTLGGADGQTTSPIHRVAPGSTGSTEWERAAREHGATTVVPELVTRLDAITSDGPTQLFFIETAPPSITIEGRYELLEGRWPQQAGECIASGSLTEVRLVPGDFALTLVGRVRDVFDPRDAMVLCAPGTWASWSVPDYLADGLRASTAYLWMSPHPAETAAALAQEGVVYSLSRDQILDDAFEVDQQNATSSWPSFVVVLGVNLAAVVRLRRWLARQTTILWQVGVPRRPVAASLALALVAAAALACAAGVVVGVGIAFAARPGLVELNGGKPIAPLEIPTGVLAAMGAMAAVGVALGLLLPVRALSGRAAARARARRQRLSDETALTLAGAAFLAFLAIGMFSRSSLLLALGSALAVVSATLCLPWLLSRALPRLRRGVRPRALAARIIGEQRSRTDALTGSLALGVGLIAAMLTMGSAAAAGVDAINEPAVPAGTAVATVTRVDGTTIPADTVSAFAAAMGDPPSIELTHVGYVQGHGPVVSVASVEEARRLLPQLSAQGQEALARGEIVFVQDVSGPVELSFNDGKTTAQATASAHPLPVWQRSVLFSGIVLTDKVAAPRDGVQVYKVFYGLSGEQLAAAEHYVDTTGLAADFDYHRPVQPWGIPLWLQLAAVAFGFGFALFAALSLRLELQVLAPALSGLRALGLSRAWITHVALWITGLVVVPALVAAAVGAVVPVPLILFALPGWYDPAGVPWAALLATCSAVTLGAAGGALWALRQVRSQARELQA